MGAALAYYSVFSAAPLLLIALAIAGSVFGESAAQRELHAQISGVVGNSAAAALEEILGEVHSSGGGVLGSTIGAVLLFFGASGVFAELHDALNSIWKVPPSSRPGIFRVIRERLFSFLVVLGTGILLLALVVAGTVLHGFEHVLSSVVWGGEWMLAGIDQAFSLVVVTVLFAIIYKTIPDTRVTWREVCPGACVAAVLFTIGKYVISLYLTRGAIASAFGAAGCVVVLLTWVYYSSQILLLGAEVASVYARLVCGRQTPVSTAANP
jgi:membrane protein